MAQDGLQQTTVKERYFNKGFRHGPGKKEVFPVVKHLIMY